MVSVQEKLYLEQLYRHPALRGKINHSLDIAPFSDQLVYLVQEALKKTGSDFVLKCGYDVLRRVDPGHFPPLSSEYFQIRDSPRK